MLGISRSPQSGIEGDVVVADLEVLACGHDGCLPPDAVDDQPVTDLLATAGDSFQAELLKHLPDPGIGFVPLPEGPLALFK